MTKPFAANVVVMADSAAPTAPTDGIDLFSLEVAGRSMLSWIDSAGMPIQAQPWIARNGVGWWAGQPATAGSLASIYVGGP